MSWVLLVEDEADHRLLIRESLSRLDPTLELHEVENTTDAVAWIRARAKQPGGLVDGVIMLDLGLPGPSGFRLLEWVREHEVLNNLPVVVLTASENPMDAEYAFFLGAKGYFQKPADFREYLTIFQRAMELAHVPGSGPKEGS